MNASLMRIPLRAERNEPATLFHTFVDIGALVAQLTSTENQIIYGRRGTGKTHALIYLGESVRREGHFSVYIDLRTIGSSGGIYADSSLTIAERGTRLLIDVLGSFLDALTDFCLTAAEDTQYDFGSAMGLLDRFAEQISQLRVVGSTEREATVGSATSSESGQQATASASPVSPTISASTRRRESMSHTHESRVREAGTAQHYIHFGAIHKILSDLLAEIPTPRVWLLLDEWSDVPVDLQPLLADLIKRCLLPLRSMTVKIGAIEHRTCFRSLSPEGNYVGLEVGADIPASIDLDDFLVFGHNPDAAKNFFRDFLFKHVRGQAIADNRSVKAYSDAQRVIDLAFANEKAFEEFVKAAEGVPRDGLNIIGLAAQAADASQVYVEMIREAAERWFVRDKSAAIGSNEEARALLHWVIDKVVRERKTRAFMVEQTDSSHPLLDFLYDSRAIHMIVRSRASADFPGKRYDIYSLDYGCFIDLRLTGVRPQGLLMGEDRKGKATLIDVPPDDPGAARRSILDLDEFEARLPATSRS